jgi:hypothetical protein
MPGFDGTGPMGKGRMTGRGMGLCGRGAGTRKVFGRRNWNPDRILNLTEGEQKKVLEEQQKVLQSDLEAIKNKLKELE